jgi:hypothetical protein
MDRHQEAGVGAPEVFIHSALIGGMHYDHFDASFEGWRIVCLQLFIVMPKRQSTTS